MTRHPAPAVIARQLRRFADILDDEGQKAIDRAALLAARGYPTNTGGGPRGNSDTTSTERAAGLAGEGKDGDPPINLTPPAWAGIDETLAMLMRTLWAGSLRAEDTIQRINSHAPDDDPLPAGTGFCQACDRFCRPTARRPGDRLRSGFCPACDIAWRRWRRSYPECTRDQFIYSRWLEANPDGTTDDYLAWRRTKIDAAA